MKKIIAIILLLISTAGAVYGSLNPTGVVDELFVNGQSMTFLVCPAVTGVTSTPDLKIKVAFSRKVFNASLTSMYLVHIDTGANIAPIDWSYADNQKSIIYTFKKDDILADTRYSLNLKQNVLKYKSGGSYYYIVQGSDYITTTCFKTENTVIPPSVVSVTPSDSAAGVGIATTIDIKFSEPMNISTITSSNIYLTSVAGVVTYDGITNTAKITPGSALSYNTVYTINVTTSVKNATGLSLPNNFTSTFTTLIGDTTPPTVLNIVPANSSTNINVNDTIYITFSEPVDGSTINGANIKLMNGGSVISAAVSYDSIANKAILNPDTSLDMNTIYTISISNDVKDLATNSLATFSSVFTTTGTLTVYPSDINNYSQIPPFVTTGTTGLRPNVLIVLDNSGSMGEFAYKTDGKGAINNKDNSYNPNNNYYGYFTTNLMYKYTTTGGGFFEVDGTKTYDATSFWSGNMLNWLTMRRVDVVRKVLVGGKTIPRSANTANYLLINENTANRSDKYKAYNSKYYNINNKLSVCADSSCSSGSFTASYNLKVYVGDQPPQEGLLLRHRDKINFGVMVFNYGTKFEDNDNGERDGGNLIVDMDTNGTNLITQVENADPENWTPLAETFYEGVHYFMGKTGPYTNTNYGAKDPITALCQKQFMLILTDGESTKDRNLPGGAWGSPISSTSDTGALNVTSTLSTIGTNEGTPTRNWTAGTVGHGSWYLPAVSYWAHTTDLRSATVGKSNLEGTQNITSYFVYAFDNSANARELLKLAAKYGGFEDNAYTSSSLPNTTAKWDANSDGIPDTYFEASQGDQLVTALESAIEDILSKVSSGTSASIVNNKGESGANLFQAVFYPKRTQGSAQLYWFGELQNMWYYLDPMISTSSIREDTDINKYLDLKADYKVTLDYDTSKNQTVANWYQDTTGTGNYTFLNNGNPDSIKALWRAGGMLHRRNAAGRTVFTNLSFYNATYNSSAIGYTLLDTSNNITMNSVSQYMNVPDVQTGKKIIDYIKGIDYPGDTNYRNRTTTIVYPGTQASPLNTTITGTWKLGDVVSSTPQAQTAKNINAFDTAYNDSSYSKFYSSTNYKKRNMVYTAANDGMLHAFRIGAVERIAYSTSNPNRIAKLSNTPINNFDALLPGDEEWAYIPKNVLPYLKYYGDPAYNHLYYVNNTVLLTDVSIGKANTDTTCSATEYWKCNKKTTYQATGDTKALVENETTWKTVLLGGMGLGGASRDYAEFCNADDSVIVSDLAHETRKDCVKSPAPNIGLSSFYALDVTDPRDPKFMWEFSDAVLPAADKGIGYSISGPAIVRVNTKNPLTNTRGNSNITKNGRWFAVYATGPTGPIDKANHQFMGRSDQKLKIYVVDINPDLSSGWTKGTNYWVFDSGHTDAFASDLTDVVVDVDRWNTNSSSHYSDDVVYVGYTKKHAMDGTWTDGGILRLLTNNSLSPSDWKLSTLISGIGPVVASPTKLQDRKKGKMWVYFGTGRYFFKDGNGTDDEDGQRHLFGIQDTCYNGVMNNMDVGWDSGSIPVGCTAANPATLTLSDLQDQSTTIVNTLPTNKYGWYISLDPSGDYKLGSQMIEAAYGAERVVTNTSANFNGTVFYTTFKPSEDICSYGGSTLVWIVNYANGGVPPASAMKGKLLVQLSGGEFITIDLATATKGTTTEDATRGDRRIKASLAGHGVAGSKGGSLQGASHPIKKILHVMEK